MRSEQLWILEWSHETNNLHVQPLSALLGLNMARFVLNGRVPGDYVPLAIGTKEQVRAAADTVRATLIKREKEKSHV